MALVSFLFIIFHFSAQFIQLSFLSHPCLPCTPGTIQCSCLLHHTDSFMIQILLSDSTLQIYVVKWKLLLKRCRKTNFYGTYPWGIRSDFFLIFFTAAELYGCLSVSLINTKCDGNHRYKNLDNLMNKTAIHSTS